MEKQGGRRRQRKEERRRNLFLSVPSMRADTIELRDKCFFLKEVNGFSSVMPLSLSHSQSKCNTTVKQLRTDELFNIVQLMPGESYGVRVMGKV